MSDELYGIDKENAHKRAIELVPEEFFWSPIDELAPFGSDEGDTALAEFRDWREENKGKELVECLKWTIEEIGEMDFEAYNEDILSRDTIKKQIEDPEFDDHYYLFTLDISVIATGFGQLIDEGHIDQSAKSTIKIAINRQVIWSELHSDWEHSSHYISNLDVLKRVLAAA